MRNVRWKKVLLLPRFQLSQLLEREANNLDLIRLICACTVIYGHAFALIPDSSFPALNWDPSLRLGYSGVYCASIAVKVFFFISGLVVTNSLLVKKSVSHFVIGRFFRIWPALATVVVVTAFLIGPWLTSLDRGEYFSRFSVYQYVVGSLMMWMPGYLPGVLVDSPLASVNGTLWTLPLEVAAYLSILFLAVAGIFRHRILSGILWLLIMTDLFLPHSLLLGWMDHNPQRCYPPLCFALGAFLAVFKDSFFLSPAISLLSMAIFWLFRATVYGPILFHFSLFIILLYVSGLPWMRKIKPKYDLSYGTYLWGLLIQQILAEKYSGLGLPINLGIALVLALGMGFLSWHLIEKPAIRLGQRLANRWITMRPSNQSSAAIPWVILP